MVVFDVVCTKQNYQSPVRKNSSVLTKCCGGFFLSEAVRKKILSIDQVLWVFFFSLREKPSNET